MELTVLDCLRDVVRFNAIGLLDVGDGAADTQCLVMGAIRLKSHRHAYIGIDSNTVNPKVALIRRVKRSLLKFYGHQADDACGVGRGSIAELMLFVGVNHYRLAG